MRVIVSVSFVFLALAGTGCHSLKAPSTPSEIWNPPTWEKSLQAEDPVWTYIRGQDIESSKPLTLMELVDIALCNNPKTQKAWQEARASQTEITQAQSQLYPQITVSSSGGKSQTTSHPHLNDVNEANIGMDMKATWLLLDFGGRSADIRGAKQALLSANFLFNQSVQDLLLNVLVAYYQHYSAVSMVEAGLSDARDAKTAYEAAEEKLRVGLAAKLDVLQTKSSYENSLYNLEEAKGRVKSAKADLAMTLGLAADTPFSVVPPSEKIPTDITEDDVSKIIEEGMKMRPDVAAERASLREKENAIKKARSDLLPKLNARGSMGSTWHRYYRSNVKREHDYEYEGFLSIDWDVFDGFKNLAKYRQAKALAKAERMKLIDTEIEASADIWKRYYDFKTAVRKLKFSKAYSATSQESYNLALESYRTGLKSILDLLDSQASLSEARSQLIQAKEDTFLALSSLAHATGTIYARRNTLAAITAGEGK